jgi:hypothetical protein
MKEEKVTAGTFSCREFVWQHENGEDLFFKLYDSRRSQARHC